LQPGRVFIPRRTICGLVSESTQAVVFNGLPLLLLAAAYAAVAGALLWCAAVWLVVLGVLLFRRVNAGATDRKTTDRADAELRS